MKKPVRKISVAAPVASSSSKAKPKQITVSETKLKPIVAQKSSAKEPVTVPVQASAPKKPRVSKVDRVTHDLTSLYTGDSPGLNKRKSVTVLDLSVAGTKPDYILKDRSELIAETIKREYNNRPFPRGNLDAGVLKHLLWKGHIEPVSGNGGEDTVLRFTKEGLAHRRSV